jgi:hypothetical protein
MVVNHTFNMGLLFDNTVQSKRENLHSSDKLALWLVCVIIVKASKSLFKRRFFQAGFLRAAKIMEFVLTYDC